MLRRSSHGARRAGFAVAMVLVLVAIIGVLSAEALRETLFGQTLASAHLLHQRAEHLADLGIAGAVAALSADALPGDYSTTLHPLPELADSVTVSLHETGVSHMAAGFSAERFAAHRFQIQSTGRTSRNSQAVQWQGVTRVLPQVAAASP